VEHFDSEQGFSAAYEVNSISFFVICYVFILGSILLNQPYNDYFAILSFLFEVALPAASYFDSESP
jgi:hypothetical protein